MRRLHCILAGFLLAAPALADIYLGGQEYTKVYVGAQEFSAVRVRGEAYLSAAMPDRPGTLSVTVTRVGRNYNFVFSITDPDGIRSLSTATVTSASQGTVANVLGDFSRSDASTFAGTDTRRNARWAAGTLSVTYVDNRSGATVTLTQTWTS